MTEHKFTDDEIIRALETIDDIGDCSRDCIFYDGKVHHCASVFAHHALDLIKRCKAEIERLQGNLQFVRGMVERQKVDIEELRAMLISDDKTTYSAQIAKEAWYAQNSEFIRKLESEIERLKGYNKNLQSANTALSNEILDIKAEAIKEFAERLHKDIDNFREKREMVMLPYTEAALLYIEKCIDNLVKEMTEGES